MPFSLLPASWPGPSRFDQSIATRRTTCVPGLSWEWSLCRCVFVSHFPYGYVASDLLWPLTFPAPRATLHASWGSTLPPTCPTSPFQLDATLTDFVSRYDMPAPAPRLLQICTGNFPGRRPQSSPRHATTSTGCQRQTRLWRASTPLLSTQHDEMPWRRVCRCAGVPVCRCVVASW